MNQSLWCSFIVKGSERSFAHIGDTGYSSSLYKAIGEVCGPVDLATIPIGSCTLIPFNLREELMLISLLSYR